ncbi:hypothetical protein [Chlorogloeopsis sp. ULAP02]|uniref:hypothetical protein n=1 Tax=Chlorogloeopsis sp. ULAP02 TaxID=3107926 RepID=UPI00313551BF
MRQPTTKGGFRRSRSVSEGVWGTAESEGQKVIEKNFKLTLYYTVIEVLQVRLLNPYLRWNLKAFIKACSFPSAVCPLPTINSLLKSSHCEH